MFFRHGVTCTTFLCSKESKNHLTVVSEESVRRILFLCSDHFFLKIVNLAKNCLEKEWKRFGAIMKDEVSLFGSHM
jgi:hypothetical protein